MADLLAISQKHRHQIAVARLEDRVGINIEDFEAFFEMRKCGCQRSAHLLT